MGTGVGAGVAETVGAALGATEAEGCRPVAGCDCSAGVAREVAPVFAAKGSGVGPPACETSRLTVRTSTARMPTMAKTR